MSGTSKATITSDKAFELFADPYRRRLLMTLLDHNPEDEIDIPDDLTTDDNELEQMLFDMTHIHLPKLESLGVIAWDQEKAVITKGPMFDELRPLLELIDRHHNELPEGWL